MARVILDRLRGPLLGSYVLAWIAFNWDTWTTFIFSNEPIENRIATVEGKTWVVWLVPLVVVALYAVTTTWMAYIIPIIRKLLINIRRRGALRSQVIPSELKRHREKADAKKRVVGKRVDLDFERKKHELAARQADFTRQEENVQQKEASLRELKASLRKKEADQRQEAEALQAKQANLETRTEALRSVAIWFDPEGDFLEVLFDRSQPGHFRETADDRVMEKVDAQGNVIGFSILGVSSMRSGAPFDVALN